MPRLIDADALLKNNDKDQFVDWCDKEIFDAIIEDAPAVDAVEVVHGEWILLDECANEGVYCSVCHKKVYSANYANQKIKSDYCPNCGAKMDGERKVSE